MEQCFLYIIYSSITDKYYIGVSKDIQARLIRHNQGTSRSTSKGAPQWKLMHIEIFSNRSLAMKREAYLKRMKSRIMIEKIIIQNK